jgi:hypothetical protein
MQRAQWGWSVWGLLLFLMLIGCDVEDNNDAGCFLEGELEPNDVIATPDEYVSQAQLLGEIFRGDCFSITGDLIDEVDTDGYGFFLFEDQTLVATLFHSEIIDLEVLFFDADLGLRIARCRTTLEPETCEVFFDNDSGGINVDVVVQSTSGSGSYTLEIASF